MACVLWPGPLAAESFTLRPQQLTAELGIGYAVSLTDVNGDGRLDIVVVDTERVIWFEQPPADPTGSSWPQHVIIQGGTRPHNVCLAPYDIDGDGLLDFALGADWRPFDTATGGTIQWLHRDAGSQSWSVLPIGEEPTVHRMRFADLDGDGRHELIVVPLMGRGTERPTFDQRPLRILAYRIPDDPVRGPWNAEIICEQLHVAHNFWPTDLDRDGRTDILVASYEGISLLRQDESGHWQCQQVGAGHQARAPARGASEIKHGRLAHGDYLASIEPWHGDQVVVYTPAENANTLWTRHVLDAQLKWGHAVWCVNLDADPDEELVIGVRDDLNEEHRMGVRIYDPLDASSGRWERTLVDPGGVAVEDLAAADLDGDGRADIVAVGRHTHNVRIYWNRIP
ncbi:MAG: VCBS repeat-containing protein [Pirellulales bacterium]|nr:VCBS repeat-containing protein [Pirellulales bacterium]